MRSRFFAVVDPQTFSPVLRSSLVGYDGGGWVRSPDGKLLAVAIARRGASMSSTLRFANVSTLKWVRTGVTLFGNVRTALWPASTTIFAVVGSEVETIDVVRKKVVDSRQLDGLLLATARSADGLVLLVAPYSEIGPLRVVALGPDGSLRSVRLDRVRGGTVWDQDHAVGTRHEPGLAVDPAGMAYVVDADGLVAQVALHDLSVEYHVTSSSLLARASAWLTPAAHAKGANGPARTAQWLGDGLIAVTGSDEFAAKQKDGSLAIDIWPAGLSVIDTRDWSIRTIDARATAATVADGALLVTGGSFHYDGQGQKNEGAGVAAYGPDGRLRWRIGDGTIRWVAGVYGSIAAIGGETTKPSVLVDLQTGTVLRSLGAAALPRLLLGAGS